MPDRPLLCVRHAYRTVSGRNATATLPYGHTAIIIWSAYLPPPTILIYQVQRHVYNSYQQKTGVSGDFIIVFLSGVLPTRIILTLAFSLEPRLNIGTTVYRRQLLTATLRGTQSIVHPCVTGWGCSSPLPHRCRASFLTD